MNKPNSLLTLLSNYHPNRNVTVEVSPSTFFDTNNKIVGDKV